MIEPWSFEAWFLWILLVGGSAMSLAYCAEQCKKTLCPAGTTPYYLIVSYDHSCVCEPVGWRE